MLCYVCREQKKTYDHIWQMDKDTGHPKMGVPACKECYIRIMYDHEWIKPFIKGKKPTTK